MANPKSRRGDPFIVGVLGVYGRDPDSRRFDRGLAVTQFRRAQFAAVEQYDRQAPPACRGNVIAVDSGPYYELALSDIYWKRRLTSHWQRPAHPVRRPGDRGIPDTGTPDREAVPTGPRYIRGEYPTEHPLLSGG